MIQKATVDASIPIFFKYIYIHIYIDLSIGLYMSHRYRDTHPGFGNPRSAPAILLFVYIFIKDRRR